MRVLSALSALLLLSSSLTCNEEVPLSDYLSGLKQRQFSLQRKQAKEQGLMLRDSWLSPLNLNYSYNKSTPYDNEQISMSAGVSIDQPIFKFGGIYFGIKYANASLDTQNLTIAQQERILIAQALRLLMQIKKGAVQIERQKLLIDNARINLEQKREQYMGGQLDSGFLDSAIIEKNSAVGTLYDLQSGQERLISQFKSISDADYTQLNLPHLEWVEADDFMTRNVDLMLTAQSIERDYYQKQVTMAKYFPTISLTGAYKWERSEKFQLGNTAAGFSGETHYWSYGAKATMALDFNSLRDVESARLTYLQSKVSLEDAARAQSALYEQVKQNLSNFERRIALSQENRALYETLVHDTRILYESGYKTEYDLQNMQNSLQIETLNIAAYGFDRQIELLNLYEKLYSDL